MTAINTIENSYYPQFGEKTGSDMPSWKKIAKAVAAVAMVILTVVMLAGPLAGFATAAGIVTVIATKEIIQKIRQLRFFSEIPKAELVPSNVGKYSLANVRLAKTSQEGMQWKKELIASAQESLELSANFAGGSTFREVLAILKKKMQERPQFKTHMLLTVDFLEKEDLKILQSMQTEFESRFQLLITDRHFRVSPVIHSEENHVKLLVVDGKYFVAGGSGIHPRLSSDIFETEKEEEKPTKFATLIEKRALDMDIVAESKPLSETLRRQFFNLYRIWETRTNKSLHNDRFFPLINEAGYCKKFHEGEGLIQSVRLKCIVGGPEHRGKNPIVRAYAKRILKAKSEVRLANLQFNPTKKIREALGNARPHKKIIGYFNGIGKVSTPGRKIGVLTNRRNYPLLHKVYEFKSDFQMYHKKVATFDDTHLIIGSFNIGEKSCKFDHELVVVAKDQRVTRSCKAVLKMDGKRSTKHYHTKFPSGMGLVSLIVTKLTENFI